MPSAELLHIRDTVQDCNVTKFHTEKYPKNDKCHQSEKSLISYFFTHQNNQDIPALIAATRQPLCNFKMYYIDME